MGRSVHVLLCLAHSSRHGPPARRDGIDDVYLGLTSSSLEKGT